MAQPTEEQRRQWEEKLKNMSPEELQELQRQQCIFCQIVSGKIPSKKVYEDTACIAVLDINPAAKGHLLLLPKEHYAIMPQVPEKTLGHLAMVAKNLSQALLKVLRADGTTVFIANGAAAGQRAQHFMVHLFPRRGGDTLLQVEEHLVGQEMVLKVTMALEKRILALLGKKEVKIKAPEQASEAKPLAPLPHPKEAETFITSPTAKRYHKEKCAFAQNIPAENKIILTKEEAEKSESKPCTCVSGKKIPLVKPVSTTKKKDSKKKSKTTTPKRKNEEASLDDIAKLFK